MDLEKVSQVTASLIAEHREVAAQLEVLQGREAALRRAIQGLADLHDSMKVQDAIGRVVDTTEAVDGEMPDALKEPAKGYPRGAEAVRRVLIETRREMNVPEITEELHRRGWSPLSRDPQNATSSNAGRAVEVMPDIVRRRSERGFLYRYEPPEEDLPATDEVTTANLMATEAASHGRTTAGGVTPEGEEVTYSS